MIVKIRKAKSRDVRLLSGRLREADALEVIGAGAANVADGLAESFQRSTLRRTIELDGLPVGMFGLVPDRKIGAVSAQVWLLGTPELSRIKKTFVRESRRVLAEFLKCYPVLWNVVDVRYTSAIRWLESCGAKFQDKESVLKGFRVFTLRA